METEQEASATLAESNGTPQAELGNQSSSDPRQCRVDDLRQAALQTPDPLRANVQFVTSDLFFLSHCYGRLIQKKLNEALEGDSDLLGELRPHVDTLLRIDRQLDRFYHVPLTGTVTKRSTTMPEQRHRHRVNPRSAPSESSLSGRLNQAFPT